jgi:hypothetical protein
MKYDDLSDLSRLQDRISRLESQNRFLRRGILALFGLGVCAAVGVGRASSTGNVVSAERFVIRDTAGRDLGTLGVDASGNIGLDLADTGGRTRVALGVNSNGTSGLVLSDGQGDKRAAVSTQRNGKSGLTLYDGQGRPSAGIALDQKGAARISPALGVVEQKH